MIVGVVVIEIITIQLLTYLCRNRKGMDSMGCSLLIFVLAVLFFCGDLIYMVTF